MKLRRILTDLHLTIRLDDEGKSYDFKLNIDKMYHRLNPSMTDYVAGIAGGFAVVLVGHPFDTTKTRLQVAPNGTYTSTMDCVRKTCHSQGIKGFYSGICSPLAGQMLFRSVSFGTYHYTAKRITAHGSNPSPSQLFLAGGMTGLVISFIETPIDLVKTKVQAQIFSISSTHAKTTVCQSASNIVKLHGIKALWQGWSATAIRNTPANAVFFPMNEIIKQYFATAYGTTTDHLHTWQRLVAGAGAGLSYWISTYPLDVIKGRMQAVSYTERMSWIETAKSIYNEYGWRGYTRGLTPCAMRAVPACAVMFSTVDYVRQYLTTINDHHKQQHTQILPASNTTTTTTTTTTKKRPYHDRHSHPHPHHMPIPILLSYPTDILYTATAPSVAYLTPPPPPESSQSSSQSTTTTTTTVDSSSID